MEINATNSQHQTAPLQGIEAEDGTGSVEGESTATESQSVLSGDNLQVRLLNDMEKLLATFEAKKKEKQLEACKTQLAAVLSVMCGRHAMVGVAYAGVLGASETVAKTSADVVAAEVACAQAHAELAQARKAHAELENGGWAPYHERREVHENLEKAERKVAECEHRLAEAKGAQAAAVTGLGVAVACLDAVRGRNLVLAMGVMARQLSMAAHLRTGEPTTEEKAAALVKQLAAFVEQLGESNDKEVRELLARLMPDLVFLLAANYDVPSGNLPLENSKMPLVAVLLDIVGHRSMVGVAYAGVLGASENLMKASADVVAAQFACTQAHAELDQAQKAHDDLKPWSSPHKRHEVHEDLEKAERKVAESERALAEAKSAQATAATGLGVAMTCLDVVCGRNLILAMGTMARQLAAAAQERNEPTTEEKAAALVKEIAAYIEQLGESNDKEIQELLAKLLPSLVFLVTANYEVTAGDLPQYAQNV